MFTPSAAPKNEKTEGSLWKEKLVEALKERARMIQDVQVRDHTILVTIDAADLENGSHERMIGHDAKGNMNFLDLSPRQHAAVLVEQFLLTNSRNMRVYIQDHEGRAVLPTALMNALEA